MDIEDEILEELEIRERLYLKKIEQLNKEILRTQKEIEKLDKEIKKYNIKDMAREVGIEVEELKKLKIN